MHVISSTRSDKFTVINLKASPHVKAQKGSMKTKIYSTASTHEFTFYLHRGPMEKNWSEGRRKNCRFTSVDSTLGKLLYDAGYRIGNYVYSSKLLAYRIYGNKRVACATGPRMRGKPFSIISHTTPACIVNYFSHLTSNLARATRLLWRFPFI